MKGHLDLHGHRYTPTNFMTSTPATIARDRNHARIQAACDWTAQFSLAKEIEAITPDSYERNFWDNGKPRAVIPLVNGEKHGIEHDTFANGVVYADVPWKHGKKHGTFTLHREDGSVEQKLSYKNGEPYGINQWFDSNGNLDSAYLYLEDGKMLDVSVCEKQSQH